MMAIYGGALNCKTGAVNMEQAAASPSASLPVRSSSSPGEAVADAVPPREELTGDSDSAVVAVSSPTGSDPATTGVARALGDKGSRTSWGVDIPRVLGSGVAGAGPLTTPATSCPGWTATRRTGPWP